VWANNYTRVIQTAKMFTRGFLGPNATDTGRVISVTSRGFPTAVGNSLGPADACPNFKDLEGGTQRDAWKATYIPPIKARLQSLIDGGLALTDNDVTQMPYLCGFESQITGRLSPWCDVFTDDELRDYEYEQSLRYYYGVGAGTDLPADMMLPFLDSLVKLLREGPGQIGRAADGVGKFDLPKILVAFTNDGQLNELVAASGVFDAQEPLSGTVRDDDRLFYASRYSTMRGTIAFEVLSCLGRNHNEGVDRGSEYDDKPGHSCRRKAEKSARSETVSGRFVRIRLNDAVYTIPSCKDGPGSSCSIGKYVDYVGEKYAAAGDWVANCNITTQGVPTPVLGASFFTDLSGDFLQALAP
jgi:acid phosphatase